VKARLRGAEIEYDVRGKGAALLLLHAFPLGLAMWDEQAERLAASHRVIRFDARGFGGSALAGGPLTMDTVADDAAALLERLGVDQAAVAGCSMGGYAAFAFVRRHPRRLRALVLQDTRAGADSDEARASRHAQAEKVLGEGSGAAVELYLPKLLGESTHREQLRVVERVREWIAAAPPRAIADALHGLAARADSRATLGTIHVPTLVVVGEEDVLTPPPESMAMAEAVPGARLEVLPKAGHLSSLERPEDYGRCLSAFLAGL
jgi:3-oxoadipate enol-lactonase